MKKYKDRMPKVINKQGQRRGKKKRNNRLLEFIRIRTGYYYDEEKSKIKSRGFDNIRNIICIFIIVIAVVIVVCFLCRIFYQKGYNQKFEEEYDSMYQIAYFQIRDSAYREGFTEGLSAASTDWIERKTKLIAAYNSLIRYEGLSEINRKAYTYRLNELLRSPVPEEEKVEKFIEDVQEILSSDT